MHRLLKIPVWCRFQSASAMLLIFFAAWGAQTLGSPFFTLLLEKLLPGADQTLLAWTAILTATLLGIVILLDLWKKLSPKKIPDIRPLRKNGWKLAFLGFIIAVLGSGILGSIWQLLLDFARIPYETEQDITEIFRNSSLYGRLLIGFTAVLVIPFFEELLFRRTLFCFFSRWGVLPAILLTSVIFGVAHCFLLGTPSLCWIGLSFQMVYLYSRNILVSTAAHGILNCGALLLALSPQAFTP